jgi:hypothetical protein
MPTFYPNAPEKEGASPIVLNSGEDRENVDIQLRKSPAFCIEGKLQDAGGATLWIDPREPRLGAANGFNFYVARTDATPGANGEFRFCNLTPGVYRLMAAQDGMDNGNLPHFASADISIGDRDVTNVRLSPVAAQRLDGEIVWADGAPDNAPPAKLMLSLQPIARIRFPGESLDVVASIPGAFTLPALLIDDYALRLPMTEPDLYVKAVQYGGNTVLHSPVRPGSAIAGTALKIVIAHDGATLAVHVTDKDGADVADTRVLIMPAEIASEAALADALVWGQTDQSGRYTSPALPPAKYFVGASQDSIDYSPEAISRLWLSRNRFEQVELGPNSSRQLTLRPVRVE